MERQLDLGFNKKQDDESCHICRKPIPCDGKGIGVTALIDGEVQHWSYHGDCYNAEQLKKRRAKGKSNRASNNPTGKSG